jgi:hypothetical protein
MKSYVELYEEAMTTGSAGLGTGTVVNDDDMRVPSGAVDTTKRVKPDLTGEAKEEEEGPEEDAKELIDLEGDEVADAQAKSQGLAGQEGDGASASA